jgi:hypothetical protein
MNENRSYNSKAHKNKDAGVLMHSFACKYYFLIAILKGDLNPGPIWMEAGRTGWNFFLLSAVIPNGVVVTVLESCAGNPSSNPYDVTYIFSTCFDYKIICIYNWYNFFSYIVNKLKKRGKIFK